MKTIIEIIQCSYQFIIVTLLIILSPSLIIKASMSTEYITDQSVVDGCSIFMLVLASLYMILLAKSKVEEL